MLLSTFYAISDTKGARTIATSNTAFTSERCPSDLEDGVGVGVEELLELPEEVELEADDAVGVALDTELALELEVIVDVAAAEVLESVKGIDAPFPLA